MKNLKMKVLFCGIMSTVLISSTAFAAVPNQPNTKVVKSAFCTKSSIDALKIVPNVAFGNTGAQAVINAGGVIQEGDTGQAVKDVQNALGITADGIFGPDTREAVVNFQMRIDRISRANGHGSPLTPDGIVGAQTWSYLK